MSIPVELVNQGIDWPAWFQAVGSVLAIVAAIVIDQGAARRAKTQLAEIEKTRLREISERVGEWRKALEDGLDALERAARLTPRISEWSVHPDSVDQEALARIVGNAGGMLDLYLATEPPNPHLAWAVVAMRTELRLASEVVAAWKRDDVTAGLTLPVALESHLATGRHVLATYRGEPG